MKDKIFDIQTFEGKIFICCMFVGMGIGIFFGEAGAGTMIGMGVGFIADSIYSKKKNN